MTNYEGIAYDLSFLTGLTEIENWLKKQPISKADLLLRGSAALAIRGLRKQGDIDIAITQANYRKVNRNTLPEKASCSYQFYDNINVANEVLIYNDRYFDVVGGYKIVRPEVVYARKQIMGREKDRMDLVTLRQYVDRVPNDWSWEVVADIGSAPRYNEYVNKHLLTQLGWKISDEGAVQSARDAAAFYAPDDGLRGFLPETASDWEKDLKNMRVLRQALKQSQLQVSVSDLFEQGFSDEGFTRYDILVRAMYLERELGRTNHTVDFGRVEPILDDCNLYSEKWGERFRHRHVDIDHISSSESGCALSLFLAQRKPSVPLTQKSTTGKLTKVSRVSDLEMTQEDKEKVKSYLTELIEAYGLSYFVIVWPDAFSTHAGLIEKVAERFDQSSWKDVEVRDIQEFIMRVFGARRYGFDHPPRHLIEPQSDRGATVRVINVQSIGPQTPDILNELVNETVDNRSVREESVLITADHEVNKIIPQILNDLNRELAESEK